MKDAVFIFDFDGTLADTHSYIIEISNRLAGEFGYHKISDQEVEAMKDKTAAEMIEFLKIPLLKIPAILTKGKNYFFEGLNTIKPFEGIKDTLKLLKEAGATIGVLSSNSSKNVEAFLKQYGIDSFDFIHTTPKIWSKDTVLDRLVKSKGLDKKNIFYVGDETRDITAAKRLGIHSVAVGWGYNSVETLKKHAPQYFVNQPHELLTLVT
jgi:phosphoglycolate phosphatase